MPIEDIHNANILPVILLRGIVPFGVENIILDIARTRSLNALNCALENNTDVFLATQLNLDENYPSFDLWTNVGFVATVLKTFEADGAVKISVKPRYRAIYKKKNLSNSNGYFAVETFELKTEKDNIDEIFTETLTRRIKKQFFGYSSNFIKFPQNFIKTVGDFQAENLEELIDYIAFNLEAPYTVKTDILCESSLENRAVLLTELLKKESEIIELDRELSEKVNSQTADNNREYFLREQMKAINAELYGEDSPEDEFAAYGEKINSLCADANVKSELKKELSRLMKMPQGSHDIGVIRDYLDTCIELPWNCYTNDEIDISNAEKILNRDFYGMEKVKTRILELLSVRAFAPEIKGQIICLVGPPGVGKTSIAKTVAECMNRRFARVSLGGVKDEAEIRGHRRTYVAAMMGRILTAVKKSGSSNPVILLDEIDKLGNECKGDPAAAMLEVLDPEQNVNFTDHYLDIPYDLSRVLFITTANTTDTIPAPLLDRMEIIELTSYTREEKFSIAEKHLLKKEIKRHGLSEENVSFTSESLYWLIDYYTRESGVRQLEREIAAMCRKAVKMIVEGNTEKITVTPELIQQKLGNKKYNPELPAEEAVGIVNGLAWTAVGGEIMQLEVAVCKGTGKLELTGSLGEVMRESARAAVTYVRCNAQKFGIDCDFYNKTDIHIHATEAAVPKDGPSAGVTITTALVSALKNIPVRGGIAMTGEVTITGRVLKIGGLKEKCIAAYRGGIKTIFIPEDNAADIAEIDNACIENINFIPVKTADEILKNLCLLN